jgi:protein-S-isoprenylcysteine O-methyltransferase Ste14
VLLGRGYEASRDTLREHALGWGVKGFFLPLMISFMWADVNWLLQIDLAQAFANFSSSFEFLFRFTYLIDVTIAVAGYLLTFKLLGSHIRWSEPTAWGWLVCLACYPPFWPIVANNFAAYDDGFFWGNMLPDEGPLRTLWGCAILSLNFIYLWATIQFGIRFSNLTHRGILTNGPYRWVKHPAYLAKNASWWLISVPFMHEAGATEALRHCLLLLLVNAIYYWRAKTEEAHLARDPTYRAYQAWIAQHGLFAPLRRAIGWRR